MAAVTTSGKRIRAYRSERRSELARQTRQRILHAAHAAFLASGYAGTTVHDIATAAGVSVKTVEAVFGTKRRVLKAVIDVVTAGDDLPVAVLQREAARAAEATPDPVTLTERTAIDTVWLLLAPVVFRRLTRDRHWSTDDFRTWVTTSLRLVLLAPQMSPRSSGAG
jgi:AcrR family transcriptional regulator